jgi:hypothetical protein
MEFLKTVDLDTVVLAFCSFIIIVFVLSWHKDKASNLDIRQLLMKDDRLNLGKAGQLIALLVSTWILIYQTRKGMLTDWLFTGYMIAWSGANLASKYIDTRSPTNTQTYQSSSVSYSQPQARYEMGEAPMHPNEQVAYYENSTINNSSGIRDYRKSRVS